MRMCFNQSSSLLVAITVGTLAVSIGALETKTIEARTSPTLPGVSPLTQSSSPSAGQRTAFEVASIRPSTLATGGRAGGPVSVLPSGCSMAEPEIDPQRFSVTSTTLFTLLTWAYGTDLSATGCLNLTQGYSRAGLDLISGGPGWIRSDRWDVQAAIPRGTPSYTKEQMKGGDYPALQRMLRTLLEERFKVIIRREKKEGSGYILTAEKGAPRNYVSSWWGHSPEMQAYLAKQSGVGRDGPGIIWARNATMASFVALLERNTGRPILDRTGVTGPVNFVLDFTPIDYQGQNQFVKGPPLLKALEEQIGFKLEPTKSQIEIWIVDHAEKPSEN